MDKALRTRQELASDEAKEEIKRKEEELKAETLEYFRHGREMGERLEMKKDLHIKRILQHIGKTVEAFAKEKGYDVIFKREFLAYVKEDSEHNITAKIIKKLNDSPSPDLKRINEEFEALMKSEEEALKASLGKQQVGNLKE